MQSAVVNAKYLQNMMMHSLIFLKLKMAPEHSKAGTYFLFAYIYIYVLGLSYTHIHI